MWFVITMMVIMIVMMMTMMVMMITMMMTHEDAVEQCGLRRQKVMYSYILTAPTPHKGCRTEKKQTIFLITKTNIFGLSHTFSSQKQFLVALHKPCKK